MHSAQYIKLHNLSIKTIKFLLTNIKKHGKIKEKIQMSIENSVSGIIESFKKIAVNAVATTYPMEIRYGTVVSAKPLVVDLGGKLVLDSKFLIVGERFTEHSYWIKRDGKEERVTMHNGLNIGDRLTLLRMQGGQKFAIQDRIYKRSGLKLVGSKAENDVMIEALKALTNQSLAYNQISGEVIFDGKPDNGTDKPIGTELISDLIKGYKEVRIREAGEIAGRDVTPAENDDYSIPNNATVYLKLKDDAVDEPLKIRMAHELIHGLRITRGESLFVPGIDKYSQPAGYYFYKGSEFETPEFASREELETTGIPYYYESTTPKGSPFDVLPKHMTENAIRIEQELVERDYYAY